MQITTGRLNEKRAGLVSQREAAIARVNALAGAISLADELLAELEQKEPSDGEEASS